MQRKRSLQVVAKLENLAGLRRFIQEAATAFGANPEIIPDLLLATNEAATNIILHGYRGRPDTIDVEIWPEGKSLAVCLRDHAPPFDPGVVTAPDLSRPLEQRPLGGMGIYLMRQLMDELIYRPLPQGGNELILKKASRP